MPRTLSSSDTVTPESLSPPPAEPPDGEQAGQPLLEGAPSSASLDTLIQQLVPTADYYPEVGFPLVGTEGHQVWSYSRAGVGREAHTPSFCVSTQKAYIFTFLLSSRLFIEPHELLARVCHLCIEQQQLDKPVLDKVRSQWGRTLSCP